MGDQDNAYVFGWSLGRELREADMMNEAGHYQAAMDLGSDAASRIRTCEILSHDTSDFDVGEATAQVAQGEALAGLADRARAGEMLGEADATLDEALHASDAAKRADARRLHVRIAHDVSQLSR
jgi:hypothetical protein